MITLTNDVFPYTHCDLYSLTAYGIDNDPAQLTEQLDYVASKAPPSQAFPGRNVFVAEYAARENDDNGVSIDNGTPAKEIIRRLTEASLGWGVRYALFWELYDSSVLPQFTLPPNAMPRNDQMSGDWLVRPDGTKPPLYYYYQSLMTQTAIPVALRTYSGAYVSAADGGGGVVYVNAPQVGGWESLTIIDRNGNFLNSGDQINILTHDGHYLMAQNNGGGTVDATSTHPEAWETFTIWKTNGAGAITFGSIGAGDSIALQAGNGNYFVAEGGGVPQTVFSDPLDANRTSIGAWEQFGVVLRDSGQLQAPNCTSYSLTPSSVSPSSQSGSINVTVTGAPAGCTSSWAASGNGSWITVSPANGSGSGPVTVSWGQNTSTTPRSSNATVGGTTFTVSQGGASVVHGFYVLTPCRLIDTRDPNGPYGGPSLAATTLRNIVVAGQCGIPSGATSLSVNLTVVAPAAGGFLTVYPGPAASPRPFISVINFNSGQVIGNNALAGVGADGTINVYNGNTSATNFIIDVNGYFK
jgi:hypothetical protein